MHPNPTEKTNNPATGGQPNPVEITDPRLLEVSNGDQVFARVFDHARGVGAWIGSSVYAKRTDPGQEDQSLAYAYGHQRISLDLTLEESEATVRRWREANGPVPRGLVLPALYARSTGAWVGPSRFNEGGRVEVAQPRFGDSMAFAILDDQTTALRMPDYDESAGVNVGTWTATHGRSLFLTDEPGAQEVAATFGVMLDLDVGEGYASTTEEALDALRVSGVPWAFACTSSNSGGVHAAILFDRLVEESAATPGLPQMVCDAVLLRIEQATGIRFDPTRPSKHLRLPGGVHSVAKPAGGIEINRAGLLDAPWEILVDPVSEFESELIEVRENSSARRSFSSAHTIRKIRDGGIVDCALSELGGGYTAKSRGYALNFCPGCGKRGKAFVSSLGGYLRCKSTRCDHYENKCQKCGEVGRSTRCSACTETEGRDVYTGWRIGEWSATLSTDRGALLDHWRHASQLEGGPALVPASTKPITKVDFDPSKWVEVPGVDSPETSNDNPVQAIASRTATSVVYSSTIDVEALALEVNKKTGRPVLVLREDPVAAVDYAMAMADDVLTQEVPVAREFDPEEKERRQALEIRSAQASALRGLPAVPEVVESLEFDGDRAIVLPRQGRDIPWAELTLHGGGRRGSFRAFRCTRTAHASYNGFRGRKPCEDCPVAEGCKATPGHYLYDITKAIRVASTSSVSYGTTGMVAYMPGLLDSLHCTTIAVDPRGPDLGVVQSKVYAPDKFADHARRLGLWVEDFEDRVDDESGLLADWIEYRRQVLAMLEAGAAKRRVFAKWIEHDDQAAWDQEFDRISLSDARAFSRRGTSRNLVAAAMVRAFAKSRRTIPAIYAARVASIVSSLLIGCRENGGLDDGFLDITEAFLSAYFEEYQEGRLPIEVSDSLAAGWTNPSRAWELQGDTQFTGWCLRIARSLVGGYGASVKILDAFEREARAKSVARIRQELGIELKAPEFSVHWIDVESAELLARGRVNSVGFGIAPKSVCGALGIRRLVLAPEIQPPGVHRFVDVLVPSPLACGGESPWIPTNLRGKSENEGRRIAYAAWAMIEAANVLGSVGSVELAASDWDTKSVGVLERLASRLKGATADDETPRLPAGLSAAPTRFQGEGLGLEVDYLVDIGWDPNKLETWKAGAVLQLCLRRGFEQVPGPGPGTPGEVNYREVGTAAHPWARTGPGVPRRRASVRQVVDGNALARELGDFHDSRAFGRVVDARRGGVSFRGRAIHGGAMRGIEAIRNDPGASLFFRGGLASSGDPVLDVVGFGLDPAVLGDPAMSQKMASLFGVRSDFAVDLWGFDIPSASRCTEARPRVSRALDSRIRSLVVYLQGVMALSDRGQSPSKRVPYILGDWPLSESAVSPLPAITCVDFPGYYRARNRHRAGFEDVSSPRLRVAGRSLEELARDFGRMLHVVGLAIQEHGGDLPPWPIWSVVSELARWPS